MADEVRPRPFHERFEIEVGRDEVRQRFINRVNILVFQDMTKGRLQRHLASQGIGSYDVTEYVALSLGELVGQSYNPAAFVQGDFLRCLRVLEAMYEPLERIGLGEELSERIETAIVASEVDLGVAWQPPVFVRTGARLLDERLVNDSLRWLRDREYETVLEPYEKGLTHYLEAQNRPTRLADVVTDMYEATEALVKVVTGKDRDLSKNREHFIKTVQVSDYYKRLLSEYIQYGNQYRHAAQKSRPRPPLSEPEVESFIYLTGLFIRLAIRTT